MGNADKENIASRKNTMFTSVSTRSANAYQRVSVETGVSQADPHRLVDMLFDGLMTNIGAARGALVRGDVKAKCQHILTSVRIIEEGLKGSLNLAEGGELAANLERVYDYCILRLTTANARNDDAALEEVAKVLAPIADGWKHMGAAEPVSKTLM
jgi:flagellar protein FliS